MNLETKDENEKTGKKRGKIFGKINIIDAIAIIFIIAAVCGAIYRFASPNADVASGGTDISYILEIRGVRQFTVDYYKLPENSRCYDKTTGDFIGEITGVDTAPYEVTQTASDGTTYKAVKPDAVIIYLTVKASGRETNDAYYVNGTYKIKIGSEIQLVTKYNDVTTTVVGINDKKVLAAD